MEDRADGEDATRLPAPTISSNIPLSLLLFTPPVHPPRLRLLHPLPPGRAPLQAEGREADGHLRARGAEADDRLGKKDSRAVASLSAADDLRLFPLSRPPHPLLFSSFSRALPAPLPHFLSLSSSKNTPKQDYVAIAEAASTASGLSPDLDPSTASQHAFLRFRASVLSSP